MAAAAPLAAAAGRPVAPAPAPRAAAATPRPAAVARAAKEASSRRPSARSWEYDTTDQGDGGTISGTKSITVEASEPVPGRAGITAVRIHTLVPGAEDQMTWQAETATAIVRYRDDIYVAGAGTSSLEEFSVYAPSKLRIDTTHLTTNQTYQESYTESVTKVTQGNSTSSTSKPFSWKVINGSESITVPAGTFTALHVQKANGNSAAIDKDYWFVSGVGKVKETAASTDGSRS